MRKQEWKNNDGQLHREDGPAFIGDTSQAWFVDGERHRYDGPAIISSNRTQYWLVNGKDISEEVLTWIEENNIPEDYTKWTDQHRVLFRLKF